MMDYEQTKFTVIDKVAYCDFCGEKCKVEVEIDYRDEYKYYTCTCEQSKEYVKINEQLQKLNYRMTEIERQCKHVTILNKLMEKEIDEIKRKYDKL